MTIIVDVKNELLDRLEAAEKERDELLAGLDEWIDKTEWVQRGINEGAISAKYVGLHRADVMTSLLGETEKERDALRAALQHETDCVEAAKAEIKALRAKVAEMEKQEPSHWGCTVLQSDGRWKEEVSREAPPEGYFSIRDIFPLYALPVEKGEEK